MKRWCLLLLPLVANAACDAGKPAPSDELTIVVQGDRRELEQQEKSLREREDSLRAEKAKLESQIDDLTHGLKAAADAEQRRTLEEKLQSTRDLERQMTARQTALQAQKGEVLARKVAMDGDPGAATRAVLALREASAASREAKLGEREGLLAARERDVAAREKALAQREAAAPAVAAPQPLARDVPKANAIEAKHRKVLADLEARGILMTDLPAEDQPLNAEIFAARRQGDLARASDLVAELGRVLLRLKVDQRFVEQKMNRLQAVRGGAKLAEPQRADVAKLLRDVTAAYSDGHYEQANKELNRIAAILDGSLAPG
jgi:hypothetical protein